MADLKRVLWHLLGGTRGGPQRIRILRLIADRPYNTNQIATELGLDYKTVEHHVRVLTENRIISSTGGGYGAVHLFTKDMEESIGTFLKIAAKVAPADTKAPAKQPREGANE